MWTLEKLTFDSRKTATDVCELAVKLAKNNNVISIATILESSGFDYNNSLLTDRLTGWRVENFSPIVFERASDCTFVIGCDVNPTQLDNFTDGLKFDSEKPRLALIPTAIIRAVGEVRTYGVKKYQKVDSWKEVSPERYRDALMRHICDYLDDPTGIDKESGLPHIWHVACNVAFLCELEGAAKKENNDV